MFHPFKSSEIADSEDIFGICSYAYALMHKKQGNILIVKAMHVQRNMFVHFGLFLYHLTPDVQVRLGHWSIRQLTERADNHACSHSYMVNLGSLIDLNAFLLTVGGKCRTRKKIYTESLQQDLNQKAFAVRHQS